MSYDLTNGRFRSDSPPRLADGSSQRSPATNIRGGSRQTPRPGLNGSHPTESTQTPSVPALNGWQQSQGSQPPSSLTWDGRTRPDGNDTAPSRSMPGIITGDTYGRVPHQALYPHTYQDSAASGLLPAIPQQTSNRLPPSPYYAAPAASISGSQPVNTGPHRAIGLQAHQNQDYIGRPQSRALQHSRPTPRPPPHLLPSPGTHSSNNNPQTIAASPSHSLANIIARFLNNVSSPGLRYPGAFSEDYCNLQIQEVLSQAIRHSSLSGQGHTAESWGPLQTPTFENPHRLWRAVARHCESFAPVWAILNPILPVEDQVARSLASALTDSMVGLRSISGGRSTRTITPRDLETIIDTLKRRYTGWSSQIPSQSTGSI